MNNSPYPFNQKQHIFDFKVKVNFENGNVSLTAPQIATPPTLFNGQNNGITNVNINNNHNNLTQQPAQFNSSSKQYNLQASYPYTNHLPSPYNQSVPINVPQIPFNSYPPIHPINTSYQQSFITPQKVANIELVNSSYTSLRSNDHSSLLPINNSMEQIECVICQKSFNLNEFDQHLELHKNKNRMTKNIIDTNQKGNNSNNMITQNSFNANNQSSISSNNTSQREYSFQNQSYHSNQSNQKNTNLKPQSNKNFITSEPVMSQNKLNTEWNHQQNIPIQSVNNNFNNTNNMPLTQQQQISSNSREGKISLLNQSHNSNSQNNNQNQSYSSQNGSFHLLGRIQNPILAINAQNQMSLSQSQSQSYSLSHPNNSLNYSNSSGQYQYSTHFGGSTDRNNQPIQMINPINNNLIINENSPNFNSNNPLSQLQNNNNNSGYLNVNVKANNNSSSFGHHGNLQNQIVGPSFYQNSNNSSQSSINSANNNLNSPFIKGVNRLAYIEGNNNNSNNNNNNSIGSQHQQQQQIIYENPNDYSRSFSSNGQNSSYYSSGRQISNGMNNGIQHFQTIQSRYMNQPMNMNQQHLIQSNSLYRSQQQFNSQGLWNGAPVYENININEKRKNSIKDSKSQPNEYQKIFDDDLSSISRTSRHDADISQYSDWNSFNYGNNSNGQIKMQGYNSADNSLMKNMQQQRQKQEGKKSKSKNNIYMDRSGGQLNHKSSQAFFKKKNDYMINSATSYYEKKQFKDQHSSSSQEENNHKSGRLSYVQRLKQKRMSDSRPMGTGAQSCHEYKSKNLKQSGNSNKMNKLAGSKYSDASSSSNLSKTKLPVNYLAREEFIEKSSSNTKSTHKSTNV